MDSGKKIYEKWMKAWNEDISVIDSITSKDCVVHQARSDGKSSLEKRGADALKSIVLDGLALFERANMAIEVGPIEEGNYISARWKFSGEYKGGLPGAKTKSGTEMSFHGTDIMSIIDGEIVEYWVSSDTMNLMEQMGVFD